MAVRARKPETLIELASEAVRRRFKAGYSMSAEQALETPSVFISTGSRALDRLCVGQNPGGLPIGPTQGRAIHIAGEYSTAKSVLLDHLFKATQALGGLCLCSETEGSRDVHFATAIGLDLGRLELQRPATIEEMADMGLAWHDTIRRSKGGAAIPLVWGLDSIDSTEAERSADKGMSESGGWHFGGGKSEALGAALRKIVNRTARYPTTFIMLNQTRDNVGVLFGPRKRTSGGNAPHFYASIEIMLTPSPLGMVRSQSRLTLPKLSKEALTRLGLASARGEVLHDAGEVRGRWVRARISKTKVAMTLFQEADFFVDFRRGLLPWAGLFQRLLVEGLIELQPDGKGVRHRMASGAVQDFDSPQAWLAWLREHEAAELGDRSQPLGRAPHPPA